MKKFVASSLAISTALVAPSVSFANYDSSFSATEMVVDGDYVNVRKGASTDYEVVTQLFSGQEVTAIDQFTNNNGQLWYRIDLGSVKGWVYSDLLIKKEAKYHDIDDVTMHTGNNVVQVHRGALASYREVASIETNEDVKVIGYFINELDEKWYHVDLGEIQGWVFSEYLTDTKSYPEADALVGEYIQAINDQATVHRGALSTYRVTYTLSGDEQAKVLDYFVNHNEEIWYNVAVGDIKGWVIDSSIQKAVEQDEPEEPTIDTLFVSSEQAFVHRGAMTDYKTVATVVRNQQLDVIDQFTNSENQLWYRVQLSSGLAGWIQAIHLAEKPVLNEQMYVNVENANVRKGATTSYDVVATLPKGSAVKVVDTFTNSEKENWLRVEFASEEFGWIYAPLLSNEVVHIEESRYVGTTTSELKRGAMFGYKTTTVLSYREKVTVLREFINDYGQKWVNVRTENGTAGWLPSWEVYANLNDRTFVYPTTNVDLLRGASEGYSANTTVTNGTPLLKLWNFGDWINVETASGIRGWVLERNTAAVSPKALLTPTVHTKSDGNPTLVWEKDVNFNVSYSNSSSNVLKITGDFTRVQLPSFSVKGISKIESTKNTLNITFNLNYTYTIRDYKDSLTVKVVPFGLAGKKVIVDAGHGDHDPGAISPSNMTEKSVNLKTAEFLKKELEARGAEVVLTRSEDTFLELSERTQIANESDYDAFISIHSNNYFDSNARGTETYIDTDYNFNGYKSRELANYVHRDLVSALGSYNRGVKEGNLYVNRNNELPSILVELGFLSNPQEEALLKQDSYLKKAAQGIRIGLDKYFNQF
ncbi:N-acetylmuramoyl-L-alanine amidase [Pseudalkalibacillus sp. R45]|uniref:N-acetylmuramoyl-L-alanine amidase n=1 Tax=Pseudalkalibacillus sp. R45 TaxID=3457433 RepID=UPI003FCD57B8